MMSAHEANKATKEMLNQIAKEFIINTVADEVRKAINNGIFRTIVDIVDSRDRRAAERIAEILSDEYRFSVELFPASSESPCWLDISWEANNED
jgi:hypothetical protein